MHVEIQHHIQMLILILRFQMFPILIAELMRIQQDHIISID